MCSRIPEQWSEIVHFFHVMSDFIRTKSQSMCNTSIQNVSSVLLQIGKWKGRPFSVSDIKRENQPLARPGTMWPINMWGVCSRDNAHRCMILQCMLSVTNVQIQWPVSSVTTCWHPITRDYCLTIDKTVTSRRPSMCNDRRSNGNDGMLSGRGDEYEQLWWCKASRREYSPGIQRKVKLGDVTGKRIWRSWCQRDEHQNKDRVGKAPTMMECPLDIRVDFVIQLDYVVWFWRRATFLASVRSDGIVYLDH